MGASTLQEEAEAPEDSEDRGLISILWPDFPAKGPVQI